VKPVALQAGILIYVAIVIMISEHLAHRPVITTRTVQTIAIDPDTEYERGLQE